MTVRFRSPAPTFQTARPSTRRIVAQIDTCFWYLLRFERLHAGLKPAFLRSVPEQPKKRGVSMLRYHLTGLLAALVFGFAAAPVATSAGQAPSDRASALYEQGDYSKAYKEYKKMARDGNTFAQYRMSYMSLMGLGTKPDAVESLAWAVLAAEGKDESLDEYQSAVAAMVPSKHRKKAEKKADYYLRRWGEKDRVGGRVSSGSTDGRCTGSRLAANCDSGGSAGAYWISWGQDKSTDRTHRSEIEALNEAIVESAGGQDMPATGS
jgi:TPR repeat protein